MKNKFEVGDVAVCTLRGFYMGGERCTVLEVVNKTSSLYLVKFIDSVGSSRIHYMSGCCLKPLISQVLRVNRGK